MKNRLSEYDDYYYWYYEAITRVIRGYPDVHFRHMISPSTPLGGGYVPIFDGVDVNLKLMDQGEKEAR